MTTANKNLTTAIGSLPHHNIDAALAFSFQMGIPFLPQIPIRNPWEYMIAQALEGLPGLQAMPDGSVQLDINVWNGRHRSLDEKLLVAFDHSDQHFAFEPFEPSAPTSSSWQPFIWELEERKTPVAKIQLVGPLTAQWALQVKDGTSLEKYPEVATQIYRLVLARALAMGRRLQSLDVQPILFLDEPAFFGFNGKNPRHLVALAELKLMIQTLKKNQIQVGLHCCSDTDWSIVLPLGLDILSIDVDLSLASLLSHEAAVEKFLGAGGRLSLGVIPTPKTPGSLQAMRARDLLGSLRSQLSALLPGNASLQKKILATAIYTPACGLAFHSIPDAEAVLALLCEIQKIA